MFDDTLSITNVSDWNAAIEPVEMSYDVTDESWIVSHIECPE